VANSIFPPCGVPIPRVLDRSTTPVQSPSPSTRSRSPQGGRQLGLLPFTGVAHVGYLPGERILGLSKLARVVELFARDLQTQERLTAQVAGWLQEQQAPRGVGVLLDAEHLCMTIRGVQAPGVRTVTSALRGRVRDDPRTRGEFLALATTVRG
jgi:GTP cyclohydrolase I